MNKNTVNTPSDKEEKMSRVTDAVLKIIFAKGLEGVTHSTLAHRCKVSRAWIYKYIGKEKQELIQFAAKSFGSHLIQFNGTPAPASLSEKERWKEGFLAGIEEFLRKTQDAPHIMQIYFRYKNTPTILGDCIEEIEEQYKSKATLEFKKGVGLTEAKTARQYIEVLTAFRFGLAHSLSCIAPAPAHEIKSRLEIIRIWMTDILKV